MKKILKTLFATVIMIISVCSLSACSKSISSSDELHKATKDGSVQVSHEPWGTSYEYKGDKTNIKISSDFTIMTSDDFFTYNLGKNMPGRILQDMTFDGNGHTITIKGEVNGELGKYNHGLFARLINCTVKNINIVYEIDLNINGSSGSYFGGFCGDANKCTFENVNISYNRNTAISFMTDQHGYHDSNFGGLVGVSGQSTYNNCKVSGSLYGTGGYFGGLLGYTYSDVSVSNSIFEGSIRTVYLEESCVGGLVGFCDGEIYSSKVLASKLEFIGEPQAWRSRTSSVGGLVGKLGGNLHDCYLEFKENGYFYAERIDNGAFFTTLNAGVLVGEATQGSKIKNIYADGYNDTINNVKYADIPVFTSLGVRKIDSTDVYNVYFVDDSYHYDYEEAFVASKEVVDDTSYSFEGTIHGNEAIIKVILEYDEDDGEYIPDYIMLRIGEENYELKTKGFVPNSQLEYSDKVDEVRYIINISENADHTYTIKFNKYHGNLDTESSFFTSNYADIRFEGDNNVIGGSDSYWKYDQTTGKPQLKDLDN